MLKKVLAVAVLAGAAVATAAAPAAATACYSATVVVNGETGVSQAGCV
jgi:hypothetical protein